MAGTEGLVDRIGKPGMGRARELRQLLEQRKILMAPGASDALTARLVESAGFPAIYMTGFGATAVRLGTPDLGLMTQTEMATHARDMARAVRIPIIADADTGYGGPANIVRWRGSSSLPRRRPCAA